MTDESQNRALADLEIETARIILDAICLIKEAHRETKMGFAADHCENAVEQLKLALRSLGL